MSEGAMHFSALSRYLRGKTRSFVVLLAVLALVAWPATTLSTPFGERSPVSVAAAVADPSMHCDCDWEYRGETSTSATGEVRYRWHEIHIDTATGAKSDTGHTWWRTAEEGKPTTFVGCTPSP